MEGFQLSFFVFDAEINSEEIDFVTIRGEIVETWGKLPNNKCHIEHFTFPAGIEI